MKRRNKIMIMKEWESKKKGMNCVDEWKKERMKRRNVFENQRKRRKEYQKENDYREEKTGEKGMNEEKRKSGVLKIK